VQRGAFIALDDFFYRRRPSTTRMTFVSEFLRDQFRETYGEPYDGAVTAPPSPPWRPIQEEERAAARRRYSARGTELVVGYLGGDDQRKGVDAVRQLVGIEGIELLVGGHGAENLAWPGVTQVGFVDVDAFLPACDVVVAPALFDAAPTAVTQALARGIPVVVRRASGWAAPMTQAGAGAVWDGCSPLVEAVHTATRTPASACRSITEAFSPARQRTRLLKVYERVLAAGSPGPRVPR
jgi:glycosyltransferase involved in cell wall biosynthesis